MKYKVSEIAEAMRATILCGDPGREVGGFTFSSKTEEADVMFVPMKGERVDAHDFIADAYAHGVRVTTTERGDILPETEGMTYLQVADAMSSWQLLGRHFREKHCGVPMIAITGSVGKTTTKELVALALSPLGNVLKTAGNRNGQLGVPQMMAELTNETDAAVIEMGMSMPGEMSRIASVAMPDYALITNIGVSHIGNLGSQEAIRREKLSIVSDMAEGGTLFVNGDDPLLAVLCPECPAFAGYDDILMYEETRFRFDDIKVVAYGAQEWCSYRYENEELTEQGVHFTYVGPNGKADVRIPAAGHHTVTNATVAMAVAETMGVSAADAAEALASFRVPGMRGSREELAGGIVMIDDTYNASPDSMRSGLELLCATKAKRRIAVLADILELGEHSEACHRQVGKDVAARDVDVLIAIGKDAGWIAEEASAGAGCEVIRAATRDEGQKALLAMLREGDAVLLKGSRGMGLDVIAQAMRDR